MTDSPEAKKPRFAQDKLHSNPDAPLRYFEPVKSELKENRRGGISQRLRSMIPFRNSQPKPEQTDVPRDRFGNRIFTTTVGKAYQERTGEQTKAALLVSGEGEDFLRKNPGILNDIDQGLSILIDSFHNAQLNQIIKEVNLNKGRKITNITNGDEGQSSIFLLETSTGKYVIKIKSLTNVYGRDVSQPYVNEMLQTQTLAHDLQDELASVGIAMSKFLFASGQMSCTVFEEGVHPTQETMRDKLAKLIPKIRTYTTTRTDLWKNISFDTTYQTIAPNIGPQIKTDNFIQRDDGSIIWIDPFVYFPPPPRISLSKLPGFK